MDQLRQNTWIVVADGEKVLYLRNETDGENPNFEVIRAREQDNPKDIEQSANRPGRMPDTGQGQRSALDDTDWHLLAKERFASELADHLYKKAHEGAFKRLVLVASPQTLGQLRSALHQEVKNKIVAEIDKDLTNHSLAEIEKIVAREVRATA